MIFRFMSDAVANATNVMASYLAFARHITPIVIITTQIRQPLSIEMYILD